MNGTLHRIVFILLTIATVCQTGRGQAAFPEILNKGTVKEQMDYIQERTLIYENYRAIREDMFQKIKTNSIDSLDRSKEEIQALKKHTAILNQRIDSLTSSMNDTKTALQEVTRTKNSIILFGRELNKILYNTIMWLIVAGLIILLLIGYLSFRYNLNVTRTTKKDLQELRAEHEEYRTKTRLDRERVSMEHFREIQKLKGTQY
jgi:hypothetical protein